MNKLIRISKELAEAIETLAKQNKRSFNSEVIVALEQYVKHQNRSDEQFTRGVSSMGQSILRKSTENE